jgi:hypothetical protein
MGNHAAKLLLLTYLQRKEENVTAKLECVRKTGKGFQTCVDSKQYNYTISKYGTIAEKIAKQSLEKRKKLQNYIIEKEDHAEMLVWSAKLQKECKVLFDKDKIEEVQQAKWFIEIPTNSRTYYAASDKYGKLHRFLLGLKKEDVEKVVDHINRNGLDDQLSNLRVVTTSINKRNSAPRKTNKFGCNGISKEIGRNGAEYIRASWMENDGKVHSKKFSTKKYPNALELAIAVRKQKESELGYVS